MVEMHSVVQYEIASSVSVSLQLLATTGVDVCEQIATSSLLLLAMTEVDVCEQIALPYLLAMMRKG